MITAWFVLIVVASVIIFDVAIIATKGKHHSVSAFVIRATYRHPMIAFLAGYVCGHLFWVMDYKDIWTEAIK